MNARLVISVEDRTRTVLRSRSYAESDGKTPISDNRFSQPGSRCRVERVPAPSRSEDKCPTSPWRSVGLCGLDECLNSPLAARRAGRLETASPNRHGLARRLRGARTHATGTGHAGHWP